MTTKIKANLSTRVAPTERFHPPARYTFAALLLSKFGPPLEPIDLLISARWVIPIEPVNRVLEHHAIAIREGRILALLPTAEAKTRYAPIEHIDRPQHVLLPGFVNAHTHAAMTLLRGAAENAGFDAWLKEKIWPLESRWQSPEFVRDGLELGIAGMVASGTTCFAEQYLFPDVVAHTAGQMHMRACVGVPVIDMPTAWASSIGEYINKGLALRDDYRNDPLITTAFAPHAPYTVTDSALERIRGYVDEIEIPVMMHLHESPPECGGIERPIARLERLGLLTPLFSAVHMTQ
ncbi:MAG: amidohydrolase family protein, partial [Candidatus Obscuribacterales bacterium]|nr:amidohydrolase family protein [Steroidobacteraceae bacterium]